MNQTKKSSVKIVIGIIMVCFMCQASMIIGPALADLSKAYPDVPYSNILLISTIPQLCGIVVALITGKIAGKKIGFKTLAMGGAFFALVGGIMPYFFRSFPIIIVSRIIFGMSYNVAVPLASALPLLYFDKQKATNLMGVSVAAQSIAGTVLDGIFVLCDEVIIRQQRAVELLKSLGGQLDDLVNDAGFALVFGLLSFHLCLNDHTMPPISMLPP